MIKTLFSCLGYSIVIGDTFVGILRSAGIEASKPVVLVSMTCCILLPLCSLRNLSVLGYTSLIGSGSMLYTAIFMCVRCADGSYDINGVYVRSSTHLNATVGSPWHVTPKSLVLACSLSTAFIAHYNAPRFYEQLHAKTAARFSRMVCIAYAIATLFFITVMCAGFFTFGAHADGFVINNYSTDDRLATAARVAIGSSTVFTYPLTFAALHSGASSLLGVRRPQTKPSPTVVVEPSACALLLVITAAALCVDNVAFVNNLGGSLLGAPLMYVFPPLLLVGYCKPAGRRKGAGLVAGNEATRARLMVGFGVLFTLLGAVVTCLAEYTTVL
jgi:amino acid permease